MIFHDRVNRAIEAHYGLWWTDENTKDIREKAGPEGLALIQEISAVANDPEIWIYASSLEAAYNKAQSLLQEKYPFLSPAAIMRLVSSAAYGWK